MKQIILVLCLLAAMTFPADASGIVAPEVPDDVQQIMPPEDRDLGQRLSYLFSEGLREAQPAVASGAKLCARVLCALLLLTFLRQFEGASRRVVDMAGVFVLCGLLLDTTGSMIQSGAQTVEQISQYGKLLLPVMTAALAAQGGSITAASLYAATALFDAVICGLISSVLLPMLSIILVLSAVAAASEDNMLKKLRDLLKQLMSWTLKLVLYIFTGYISLSGIISGTADQTALKAAKLTISGMVPVVGGILSDASETVLVGAAVAKNAVGIYGLLGIIAVTIVPFLVVGINYLMLKLLSAISPAFAPKSLTGLLQDFSTAMGFVLAMTGSVCLIQMISIMSFLRGMT